MATARDVLGPVVQRLLEPFMTAPSQLLTTGPVVANDVAQNRRGRVEGACIEPL